MLKHIQTKRLNFKAEDLYNLVLDIEKYPQFLPWIGDAKIISKNNTEIIAKLTADFKAFNSHYTSKVMLFPAKDFSKEISEIKVSCLEGPFKYLKNDWKFEPLKDGQGTNVHFFIDFQFNNFLLQKMMGVVFSKAVNSMMNAFEKRAGELYTIYE